MNINPAFLDVVHYPSGLIDSPTDDLMGAAFPDSLLVPRSDWRERIEERAKRKHSLSNYYDCVYNQNPESSCVHNALAAAFGIRRCLSVGEKYRVITAPMSSYGQVARSRNSGSTMWGSMEYSVEFGQLPSNKHADTFAHTLHENTPFTRRLSEGWQKTARHFRTMPDGWFRIASKEQFASALLNDMPIVYGRSGHSICAEDLLMDGRRFVVRYRDSYGRNRGDNGRLYDSERMWGTSGAWCCHSVRLPDDPNKPAGADGGVLLA